MIKIKVLTENDNLTSIKLVTDDGLKSITLSEGLQMAEEKALDLVLVNESSNICKIMNFSKYLYDQKKAKKAQKTISLKEIKFNPGIAKHDLDIKIKNAKKIVKEGNRVKVIMMYKGRIAQRMQEGRQVMLDFISDMSDVAKVYSDLKQEGQNWVVIFEKK